MKMSVFPGITVLPEATNHYVEVNSATHCKSVVVFSVFFLLIAKKTVANENAPYLFIDIMGLKERKGHQPTPCLVGPNAPNIPAKLREYFEKREHKTEAGVNDTILAPCQHDSYSHFH